MKSNKNKIILFRNKSVLENNKFHYRRNINSYNIELSENPYTKEEFLFSNKTQKEIILNQIKKSQLILLSKLKKNKNDKLRILKDLLFELKNNLSEILTQKMMSKNYIKSQINKAKNIISEKIFVSEKTQKYLEKNEIFKLKALNFEIENEIEKIDFLIKKNANLIKYLKIVNIFPEQNRELYCYNQKANDKEIDEIFKVQKKNGKKYLKKIIIENNFQESNIEKYENEIRNLKQNIAFTKILNISDVIYEDSLENKNINSLSKIHNKSKNDVFNENNLNEIKCEDNNKNNNNNRVYINNNLNNILNLKLNINLNINTNQIITKKSEKSIINDLIKDTPGGIKDV